MKKYYTHSDGGCFLFGNKDFSVKVFNGFGDCKNTVLVFESYIEFDKYCQEEYGKARGVRAFESVTIINGNFNLYNYDCSDMDNKDIKVKFNGNYLLYLRNDVFEYPILAIVKSD